MAGVPPSPPSSDPSDLEFSCSTQKSRSNRQNKMNTTRTSGHHEVVLVEVACPSILLWRNRRCARRRRVHRRQGRTRLRYSLFLLIFDKLEPIPDNFADTLDYRAYRIKERYKHLGGYVSLNVSKFIKRLQSKRKETKSELADPISILVSPKAFRVTCNSAGICDGVTTGLLPHFTTRPVSLSMSIRLSWKKSKWSSLHVERSFSHM